MVVLSLLQVTVVAGSPVEVQMTVWEELLYVMSEILTEPAATQTQLTNGGEGQARGSNYPWVDGEWGCMGGRMGGGGDPS